MLLTVLVAITAACSFAFGNAVQHRAAGRIPFNGSVLSMVGNLVRSPHWLFGSAFALTAFVLHTTAMNLGTVAVVQPFMLGAVLIAVPIRAYLDRMLPTRSEMLWLAVTVTGIIVFVSVAENDRAEHVPHDTRALLFAVIGFGAAIVVGVVANGLPKGKLRGFGFGVAAGVTFGITAGLMKFMRYDLEDGLGALLGDWHLWALLGGSLLGTTLNQRSYQSTQLSIVMPSLNSVNIVLAVTFGWVVFEEPPSTNLTTFVIQVLCLGAMALGLVKVAQAEDAAETEHSVVELKRSGGMGRI